VLDQYKFRQIDFNIDGQSIGKSSANDLRNQAIAILKQNNPGLVISYSLPCGISGLTSDSISVLASAKRYNVGIDIVNMLTMGFSGQSGASMTQNVIQAVNAGIKQIQSLGLDSKVGITPMVSYSFSFF
jgi:chitinase